MKLALILKPQLLKAKALGRTIKVFEDLGATLLDLFFIIPSREDLYASYSLVDEFPDRKEIDSYGGGESAIILIYLNKEIRPCDVEEILKTFRPDAFKCVRDCEPFFKYWFGKH